MADAPSEEQTELSDLRRLFDTGAHREVVDRAAELAARWPGSHFFSLMEGMSLTALGEHVRAIVAFKKVLEATPGQRNALTGIARCLSAVGRTLEALPYAQKKYRLHPGVQSALEVLWIALATKDDHAALFREMLESISPKFFHHHPGVALAAADYVPIAGWCARNHVKIEIVDPGGPVALPDLDTIRLEPYTAGPLQFAAIPNAATVTGFDWPISPTGEILDYQDNSISTYGPIRQASDFTPFAVNTDVKRLVYARSQDEVYIDEDAVFLSAWWKYHFGHWLIDCLPRLLGRRGSDGRMRKVFTYETLPRSHQETLFRFGLRPRDFILGKIGQVYRFRSLTVPVSINSDNPAPSVVKFVYGALAARQTPFAPGITGGRIYLQRSGTGRGRNIANDTEFQSLLEETGFQTVRRPEFTVDEQDAMFSEAGIVVTPFGTDQLTLYQLRPSTDLIVLTFDNMEDAYPLEQIVTRYCAIVGIRQHFLRCGAVPREGTAKSMYYADMFVDCDRFRALLRDIVERRERSGIAGP